MIEFLLFVILILKLLEICIITGAASMIIEVLKKKINCTGARGRRWLEQGKIIRVHRCLQAS